jgi:hypothetical protein
MVEPLVLMYTFLSRRPTEAMENATITTGDEPFRFLDLLK